MFISEPSDKIKILTGYRSLSLVTGSLRVSGELFQMLPPSSERTVTLYNNETHSVSRLVVRRVGREEEGLYTCSPPGLSSRHIQLHVVQHEQEHNGIFTALQLP